VICNICHSSALPFERAIMLRQHNVQWYRCADCGFMCTEAPYWLDEAYSETMTRSDVGAVARSLENVRTTAIAISLFFRRDVRYLDWGGGYGLFTRMMRDLGYDFFCHDPHAVNLFARGFTLADTADVRFELATAFEVFEHFVDPTSQVNAISEHAGSILLTTTTVAATPPPLGQWWYYGLEHGQHVSIYTRESLRILAARHGLCLYSHGRSLHLMTKRRLSRLVFSLVCRFGQHVPLTFLRGPAGSFIPHDYARITDRPLV